MKLIAEQAFSWAHGGIDVERFAEGEEFDTEDQALIKVATDEGWAVPLGAEEAQPAADADAQPAPVGDEPPKPRGRPRNKP